MRPEQAAEQPLNSSAFPLHQENGTLVAAAPRTARLSGLCAPHQPKHGPQKSRHGNSARSTTSQAVLAGPENSYRGAHVDARVTGTRSTAKPPYADAGPSAGAATRQVTDAPPPQDTQPGKDAPPSGDTHPPRDASASNMLAAALANHVQQRVMYRPPQCSLRALSSPQATDSHNRFARYVPGASDLSMIPPYDETVAPGIPYIEEEVVGPVPPVELTTLLSKVKPEPCSSVHDVGTGDSQGCSHTVAQLPVVPWGVSGRDSAAVDSASPGRCDGAGRAPQAPPARVSEHAQADNRHRAHCQANQPAPHVPDARDEVDALAILADIALADSAQEAELSPQAPLGLAATTPEPPAACAGNPHRAEVRKKRSLLLSAVVAPVAAQRRSGRDPAPAKKHKAAQQPASKLTKALRQAAATAAELAPLSALGSPNKTAPLAAGAKPLKKTVQLAAANAVATPAPHPARRVTEFPSLPPLASAAPAAGPPAAVTQRRIANTPRPLNVMRPRSAVPVAVADACRAQRAGPADVLQDAPRSLPHQPVNLAVCTEQAAAARLAHSRANLAAAMAAHQEAHYAAARATLQRLRQAAAPANPQAVTPAHTLLPSVRRSAAENQVQMPAGTALHRDLYASRHDVQAAQADARMVHAQTSWPATTTPSPSVRAVAPHAVTCIPAGPRPAPAAPNLRGTAAAASAQKEPSVAPPATATTEQVVGGRSTGKAHSPAATVAVTNKLSVERIRITSAEERPADHHTGKAAPGLVPSGVNPAPPTAAPLAKLEPPSEPAPVVTYRRAPQSSVLPGSGAAPVSPAAAASRPAAPRVAAASHKPVSPTPAAAMAAPLPPRASGSTNASAASTAADKGAAPAAPARPRVPPASPAATSVAAVSPAGSPAPTAALAGKTATGPSPGAVPISDAPVDAQTSRNASPAKPGAPKATRGGGQHKPVDLDAMEVAKMAAKIQMQAEKAALKAQNAAERTAVNMRTRKRRAPQSHTYPLLDGIPKRKGVYYRSSPPPP